MQEGRYDAAFAGEFAAATYGLEPLVTEIHDAENAQTRFVLVGRPARPAAPTGADKTSVVIWLGDDHPGALLELLQEFAVRGVNLMLIQSRPTGEGIGNYCFAVDAEGHIADRRVGEALMGLKRICPKVRFLGSYPRAGVAPEDVRPLRAGTSDADFTAPRTGWPGTRTAGPDGRGRGARLTVRAPKAGVEGRVGPRVAVVCATTGAICRFSQPTELSTGPVLDLGTSRHLNATWSTNRSSHPHPSTEPQVGPCHLNSIDQLFRARNSHPNECVKRV